MLSWSGSDGHVVPVAGRPLGNTVAAQVLVDSGHLLGGHIIAHLHIWAAGVRLRATQVQGLQHVLAVHHGDLLLEEKKGEKVFFVVGFLCLFNRFTFSQLFCCESTGLTCRTINLLLALLTSFSSSPKHSVTEGSGAAI